MVRCVAIPVSPPVLKKHDHENEEHHDGAGIDDDLRHGEEIRAEQEVESGERDHDADEREGARNRVRLDDTFTAETTAMTAKIMKKTTVHLTFQRHQEAGDQEIQPGRRERGTSRQNPSVDRSGSGGAWRGSR